MLDARGQEGLTRDTLDRAHVPTGEAVDASTVSANEAYIKHGCLAKKKCDLIN